MYNVMQKVKKKEMWISYSTYLMHSFYLLKLKNKPASVKTKCTQFRDEIPQIKNGAP